jgi:hypothetical protein
MVKILTVSVVSHIYSASRRARSTIVSTSFPTARFIDNIAALSTVEQTVTLLNGIVNAYYSHASVQSTRFSGLQTRANNGVAFLGPWAQLSNLLGFHNYDIGHVRRHVANSCIMHTEEFSGITADGLAVLCSQSGHSQQLCLLAEESSTYHCPGRSLFCLLNQPRCVFYPASLFIKPIWSADIPLVREKELLAFFGLEKDKHPQRLLDALGTEVCPFVLPSFVGDNTHTARTSTATTTTRTTPTTTAATSTTSTAQTGAATPISSRDASMATRTSATPGFSNSGVFTFTLYICVVSRVFLLVLARVHACDLCGSWLFRSMDNHTYHANYADVQMASGTHAHGQSQSQTSSQTTTVDKEPDAMMDDVVLAQSNYSSTANVTSLSPKRPRESDAEMEPSTNKRSKVHNLRADIDHDSTITRVDTEDTHTQSSESVSTPTSAYRMFLTSTGEINTTARRACKGNAVWLTEGAWSVFSKLMTRKLSSKSAAFAFIQQAAQSLLRSVQAEQTRVTAPQEIGAVLCKVTSHMLDFLSLDTVLGDCLSPSLQTLASSLGSVMRARSAMVSHRAQTNSKTELLPDALRKFDNDTYLRQYSDPVSLALFSSALCVAAQSDKAHEPTRTQQPHLPNIAHELRARSVQLSRLVTMNDTLLKSTSRKLITPRGMLIAQHIKSITGKLLSSEIGHGLCSRCCSGSQLAVDVVARLGLGAPGGSALDRGSSRIEQILDQRADRRRNELANRSRVFWLDNFQNQRRKSTRLRDPKPQMVKQRIIRAALCSTADHPQTHAQFNCDLVMSSPPPLTLAAFQPTAQQLALLERFLDQLMLEQLVRGLLMPFDRISRRESLPTALHADVLLCKVCSHPGCNSRFTVFHNTEKQLCDVRLLYCKRCFISCCLQSCKTKLVKLSDFVSESELLDSCQEKVTTTRARPKQSIFCIGRAAVLIVVDDLLFLTDSAGTARATLPVTASTASPNPAPPYELDILRPLHTSQTIISMTNILQQLLADYVHDGSGRTASTSPPAAATSRPKPARQSKAKPPQKPTRHAGNDIGMR